jgi:hypothetical protein
MALETDWTEADAPVRLFRSCSCLSPVQERGLDERDARGGRDRPNLGPNALTARHTDADWVMIIEG